ncbi:hypothetical protein D2W70_06550 [Burkholderia pseudomallei]|nr:hypothetical protein D2W70_06550 [Burkholderia pseudomallei]RIV67012.1 hypothetical protein D2W49_00440 [Burkholderia pseudomallei]
MTLVLARGDTTHLDVFETEGLIENDIGGQVKKILAPFGATEVDVYLVNKRIFQTRKRSSTTESFRSLLQPSNFAFSLPVVE